MTSHSHRSEDMRAAVVQYRWVSWLLGELQMQTVAGEQHCLVQHRWSLEWELLNLRKLKWELQ